MPPRVVAAPIETSQSPQPRETSRSNRCGVRAPAASQGNRPYADPPRNDRHQIDDCVRGPPGVAIEVRHPGHDQGEMLLDPLGDEPGLETSSDAVDENQKLTTDFAPPTRSVSSNWQSQDLSGSQLCAGVFDLLNPQNRQHQYRATHGQRAVGSAAQCRRRLRKKIGITAISAAPPLRKGARPNRTAIVGCAVGDLGRLDRQGGNP